MRSEMPDWSNNVKIKAPEFVYIFTVDLKGRIIEENLERNNDGNTAKIDLSQGDVYLAEMQHSHIKSFVDPYLLRHATPYRWLFSDHAVMQFMSDGLDRFFAAMKCNVCPNSTKCQREYLEFHNKATNDASIKKLSLYSYQDSTEGNSTLAGIEMKVFRSGALSILLRFRWDREIPVDKCLNQIRYPEEIVVDSKTECYLGALNKLAQIISLQVIEKFKSDIYFKPYRKNIANALSNLSEKDPGLKEDKFSDLLDGICLDYNPNMYVGVFCHDIIIPQEEMEKDTLIREKTIIALANTTPEFTFDFKYPETYLNDVNKARGQELLILERRSWLIVSKRLVKEPMDFSPQKRYRFGLLETFIYSLETILATTGAIETFNEQLEQELKKVSYRYNSNVEKFFDKRLLLRLKRWCNIFLYSNKEEAINAQEEFIKLLSKARSISPCEDITTSMEAHLKSATAIKVIIAAKEKFGLDGLITLARTRMRNYTSFLMTGHDILMTEIQKVQGILLLILTCLSVILTFILLYTNR